MLPYSDLFVWWAATITAGTMVLVLVSFFLYFTGGTTRRNENEIGRINFLKNFAFVWVMLSLLALYIVSISNGAYTMFALGNVVVEVVLAVYIIVKGK